MIIIFKIRINFLFLLWLCLHTISKNWVCVLITNVCSLPCKASAMKVWTCLINLPLWRPELVESNSRVLIVIFLFHINSIICTLPFKISFVSGRENFRLQKLEMVSCYARKRTCEINVQIQTHACPGGVLPEKLDGGVLPASQNPYPIYDQKICDIPYPIYDLTKNLKPNLWPDPHIKILSQTCITISSVVQTSFRLP